MTLFLWDASHYDGVLDRATLARAKAEGIVGFTHKVGEGLSNDDPLDGTCLAAARDAGIEFLGGYYIPHQHLASAAEATRCIALADRDEGWWRSFPGWFWQVDAERWTATDRVTLAEIRAFADVLRAKTGRSVIVYASRGQYGDALTGLGYPLWNAAYPRGGQAPFRDIYLGDAHKAWQPYSGQVPVFWQYSSSVTIAGKTTCDVSAYRGTLAQLRALIEGEDMALTPTDVKLLLDSPVSTGGPSVGNTIKAAAASAKAAADSAAAALLAVKSPVPVTVDAIKTALADPAVLAAIAKAVNDDSAARLKA